MKTYLILSIIFGILLSYTTLGSIPNSYSQSFDFSDTDEIKQPARYIYKNLFNGQEIKLIKDKTILNANNSVDIAVCVTEKPANVLAKLSIVFPEKTVQKNASIMKMTEEDLYCIYDHPVIDFESKYVGKKYSEVIKIFYDSPDISKTSEKPSEPVKQEPREAMAFVNSILSTPMQGQYLVIFTLCAGDTKVTVPEIVVSSDMESYTREVASVLMPGACSNYDVTVKADDTNSIKVQYGNVVGNDSTIEELKAEIKSLKEQLNKKDSELEKKDSILMEQLKVIQQLASSFKKTFFDPVSTILGLT